MKNLPAHKEEFQTGQILLVDKPQDWTSFDVVNKIRHKLKRLLNVKKIKVGHSGTLDPLATGLLIICTGKFTKKLESFQGLDKVYEGTMKFGATTPSYDSETEPDQVFPYEHITAQKIEEARVRFLGKQNQFPPMFSAIKVDGQPLYKKARKGEKVKVEARPIEIMEFSILRQELPELDFRVHCSKGTYIRSLIHDLGSELESGAYMTALRRTSIGPYEIKDAWNLDDLISILDQKIDDQLKED